MSYREAMLRAEKKVKAIVATWPGYHRDVLAEWMKRYDPAPVTQSILDFTPGENRLARFMYLAREAIEKKFCTGPEKGIATLKIVFPRRY